MIRCHSVPPSRVPLGRRSISIVESDYTSSPPRDAHLITIQCTMIRRCPLVPLRESSARVDLRLSQERPSVARLLHGTSSLHRQLRISLWVQPRIGRLYLRTHHGGTPSSALDNVARKRGLLPPVLPVRARKGLVLDIAHGGSGRPAMLSEDRYAQQEGQERGATQRERERLRSSTR